MMMVLICIVPACAHRDLLPHADRLAIRLVIEHQLAAFRHDDAAGAFAFASPAIQAKYRTPENFLQMVKAFYQPVSQPWRQGGYTKPYMIDGDLTQPVLLVGRDGEFVLALYVMQKQPDGQWKITGCSLIPEM
jgi:hypothetical protein